MAKKIIFVDQVSQYPNRFLVTDDGGGLKEVTPSPGTISIEGTPLSADNLNAVADEVIYKLKDTATVANTYTANIDGLLGYFDSLTVLFKPNNTNTDSSTLNLTSLGAIPIKKIDDTGTLVTLSQNDLIKGKYYTMTYDNTDSANPCFIMNNPSAELASIVTAVNNLTNRLNTDESTINSLKTETIKFTVLQGIANTYAATISTVSTLTSGLEINLIPNVTNTGASTLNVNELGAKSITYNGSAIASGMLVQNKLYKVLYNGVSFELQPSSNFTPVSNGVVQANLNADMVDGKNASDFAPAGYGLGGTCPNISNQDLNLLVNTGFYVGNNLVNAPTSGDWFYIQVQCHTESSWVSQTAKTYGSQPNTNNAGEIYIRNKVNGTWSSWRKLQNENYAVTTNSGNAYSATIGGLSSLTDGLQVRLKFNASATNAITININGLGAKNVYDYYGNRVSDVHQGYIANLAYDSSTGNFILQGKGGGGNATSADLLSGKTATVDGGQIVGSMVNHSGLNTPALNKAVGDYDGLGITAYLMPPAGYYNGQNPDAWVYSKENDLITDNIKAGKTIFGVSGKSSVVDTADATALTADKILNGYSAYANGNKINGSATLESLGGKKFKSDTYTIASYSAVTITLPFNFRIAQIQDSSGTHYAYTDYFGYALTNNQNYLQINTITATGFKIYNASSAALVVTYFAYGL